MTKPYQTRPQTEGEKRYDEATDVIDAKVEAACKAAGHEKVIVDYSAAPTAPDDQDDVPIDNLAEVAVWGPIIVYREASGFYGGEDSKNYCSEVLTNPTWLELAVIANQVIVLTNDHHHCFFEGLDFHGADQDKKVNVFRMVFGS